jgi:OMF family outer membrane factor
MLSIQKDFARLLCGLAFCALSLLLINYPTTNYAQETPPIKTLNEGLVEKTNEENKLKEISSKPELDGSSTEQIKTNLIYSPIQDPHFELTQVENLAPVKIDLPQIVNLVSNKSLDVALAKNQVEQAKGYLLGSFADLMPSLRAQQSVERFNGGEIFFGSQPVNLNRTTMRPTLSADYQIQTGGKAIFNILAYKNEFERTKVDTSRVFQETLLNTASQYFTWLRDISSIAVANQSLSEANTQVDILQSRFEQGFATKLEVLQAQTVCSDKKSLLLKAQNQKDITEITLSANLNLPLLIKIAPEEEKLNPIRFVETDLSLNQFYEIARKERPDVKELDYLIKEAKSRLGSSIADLFPTVGLSGYYRGIGPNLDSLDRSRQGMYSISVDLLRNLGLGTMGNIKVSREKIQEAVLKKEKQLKEIEKSLAESYYNVGLYKEQMNVTQQKIKETEEAYRIALARLQNGVGIYLDVAKAQTDLTQARLDYLSAVMSFNNAELKLLYETGQLSPSNILNKPSVVMTSFN